MEAFHGVFLFSFSFNLISTLALGGGFGQASLALAAVLGEIRQNGVHAVVLGAVDQVAPHALLRHQVGVHQFFQME
jgi:hypothetical protein